MRPTIVKRIVMSAFFIICLASCGEPRNEEGGAPRIVNIINFIRLTEPRYEEVTDDVLFETVQEQISLMSRYGFPGTFLVQYDALAEPRYRQLLKEAAEDGFEIGAWWEITQPHVEMAGMEWRGRYSWDWHADVGFSTGYTPREREKLVDVYMEEFLTVFGEYPRSAGSWFIDAHTLAYMHDRYGLEASCNVKDQVGTDGYTVWGGYWTGAYYPSRVNAYMPAQSAEAQIDVPVFRMLGSDPIYQYDSGIGTGLQLVESLEPVYPRSGGDAEWVDYFFGSMAVDPALGFTYAQTGQENSFTWDAMEKGLVTQFALLDSLRTCDVVRIETLVESARWFRSEYTVTPPTALTALRDIRNEGRNSAWFCSRYYRVNMLLEDGKVRLRDMHLFDERLESAYFRRRGETNQCVYHTLPVADGFNWSTSEHRAGIWLCRYEPDVEILAQPLEFSSMSAVSSTEGIFEVACEGTDGQKIVFTYDEAGFTAAGCGDGWGLALTVPAGKADTLPIAELSERTINHVYKGFPYGISIEHGRLMGGQDVLHITDDLTVWAIMPEDGRIAINCSAR